MAAYWPFIIKSEGEETQVHFKFIEAQPTVEIVFIFCIG